MIRTEKLLVGEKLQSGEQNWAIVCCRELTELCSELGNCVSEKIYSAVSKTMKMCEVGFGGKNKQK